ncbi:MAG: DUF3866 family protein, partial [Frankiaceae bacterium]|nr:DUF3866 family protein [Frankiaceae bacterium]
MIQWRSGRVTQLCARWPGAVEALVELDAPLRPGGDLLAPALAYPELVGEPEPGDRVLLNTTGLAMDPDVDARALIVVLPDRLPPDSPPEPGHLVKARYTPSQATVLGVDEQESPHHELIAAAQGIGGMPVVVADLHSALPAVVAGIRDRDPELRIAYV